ncbi:thioredoxin [Candidatus Saccharibacteria bacterium]|nr:thioredoxin [Candidatus Saccharibacteria bacterium]
MKVIKVGAVWCSGCAVMKPRWQQIEQENPWLQTEFYDYDESPEVMAQYSIDENLPVAIFVDEQGNEITRRNGEVSKDELVETIQALRDK